MGEKSVYSFLKSPKKPQINKTPNQNVRIKKPKSNIQYQKNPSTKISKSKNQIWLTERERGR
jgi:hypothetical protein